MEKEETKKPSSAEATADKGIIKKPSIVSAIASTIAKASTDKKTLADKKTTVAVGKGKTKRQMEGVVVSDKMDKTIVVKVERTKIHPKYKKRFKVHKKYKVHDEKNERKIGDKVVIEETRPLSRDKRWKIVK